MKRKGIQLPKKTNYYVLVNRKTMAPTVSYGQGFLFTSRDAARQSRYSDEIVRKVTLVEVN